MPGAGPGRPRAGKLARALFPCGGMGLPNSAIAEQFSLLADLLELQSANPFRIRAYRNAARVIENWPVSLSELASRHEKFEKIPGVGKDLEGKILEICETGRLKLLSETEKKVSPGLADLLRIPGLGPKRVMELRTRLGVRDRESLGRAARSGRIRRLPGFGEKTEKKLLDALRPRPRGREAAPSGGGRVKRITARQVAEPLLASLASAPGASQVVIAGSYRRCAETVGDLDLLVSVKPGADAASVMRTFGEHELVLKVIAAGPTRSTVLLRSGLQADLRVVPERSFGAALHYFTGSKAHNIAVRMLGVRRGLKINEYGIFRGKKQIGGRIEEEVFRSVELAFIEPELRENSGEIEAAARGELPRLVRPEDIRGDLHAHTDETDGRDTLEDMAEAARKRGLRYLAITDHSRRLAFTGGLDPRRLLAQLERIDRLNERWKDFRILKSIEVDILEDGKLDLPDDVLKRLDVRVCSIHSRFNFPMERQTERVLRAMDNRYFNILGHPFGRLIGRREPYELDLPRVIQAARERGCFLEVNAQPERLDLAAPYCRLAREHGVKVAISTDSHSVRELANMEYGVAQARRGWLEASDVINTRPWPQLRKLLRR